ncbi:MAG: glycosyltransferase [Planctomycetota bacterium]|jgi:glycosyltransferase involved in cell wall biosynthesis
MVEHRERKMGGSCSPGTQNAKGCWDWPDSTNRKSGPVVSVLLPTFNRPRYLAEALTSVLGQTYASLQVIVVNDGGEDVSGVVNSFHDPRVIFLNRRENRGKAFSLNQALERAEGQYIAYIDDDDIYYPNHIEMLVEALENQTDCRVAYSDLYRAYCRLMPDGSRLVLSKVVEVSRDFDRFLMLYFNHVLHVSLMHRRDLIEKAGPYNEDLTVLIDWDMTRRLTFFSDFYHVYDITGEFYTAAGESDRISVLQRKDKDRYNRNFMTIRTTRPRKPWSKIEDMSIIFVTEQLNKQSAETMGLIWRYTFYPYKFYLPIPEADFRRLNTDMPNIVAVPVDPLASAVERVDAALPRCEGEYIAIVPSGFSVRDMWVEDSLYALVESPVGREAYELEGSTDALWATVLRKSDLWYARRTFGNLPIRESLRAAGIILRRLRPEQIPFQFEQLLKEAQAAEAAGDYAKAAETFEYIGDHYQNELWMKSAAARVLFKLGSYARAAELSREVNRKRPTVDTLLLEARVNRAENQFDSAIGLLERAENILEGKALLWK